MRELSLILLGVSVVLSGCGKSDLRKGSVEVYSEAEGQRMLAHAQVACAPGSECSDSVALLAYATNHQAGTCTAFLIDANTVMTNSHCVAPELRAHPERAKNWLRILFPATRNYPALQIGVAEISRASEINLNENEIQGKRPDYAILKLPFPINRPPLELSRDGVADQQTLKLHAIVPMSAHELSTQLHAVTCRAVMGSAIQPSYRNAFTSVISFSGCPIVHGNSGAPMIDLTGKVRAILHAGIDMNSLEETKRQLGVAKLKPIGLATNIACTQLHAEDPLNPRCREEVPQVDLQGGARMVLNDYLATNHMSSEKEAAIREKMKDWTENTATQAPFRWNLNSSGDEYYPMPECFSGEKPAGMNENIFSGIVPSWRTTPGLDEVLRPRMIAVESRQLNQTKTLRACL